MYQYTGEGIYVDIYMYMHHVYVLIFNIIDIDVNIMGVIYIYIGILKKWQYKNIDHVITFVYVNI